MYEADVTPGEYEFDTSALRGMGRTEQEVFNPANEVTIGSILLPMCPAIHHDLFPKGM